MRGNEDLESYASRFSADRSAPSWRGDLVTSPGAGRQPAAAVMRRRLADCVSLEARMGRARRMLAASPVAEAARTLTEAEADLGMYVALLAEHADSPVGLDPEAGLPGWEADPASPTEPADDVHALVVAICDFVQRTRGAQQAVERLGDMESAGLLAELARVAGFWLWSLEPPVVTPPPVLRLVPGRVG